MPKTLLITGATGKQGGAVIDALLSLPETDEFDIYALTRDPKSTRATKLAAKSPSIKILQGDLNDPNILVTLGIHFWGIFSVQADYGGGATAESGERQAKALVDGALQHGVEQFVYSSVDRGRNSDNDPTVVPQFAS